MISFKNKILLITGGTGTFGRAVLDKFLKSDIEEIRIFSRDEKKQDDMRNEYDCKKLEFFIGDVRNEKSLEYAMSGVDIVFHAAALKQVPSCEFFPIEAINTNSLGADNVINSAIEHKVRKVIVLSTDKAVYPINAMGMSKALMEKIMTSKSKFANDNGTILCGTRYGNVMTSRGSVIPKFIEQIKNNQELTVTDPNMTRFLMSIDEAVNLVLYAFENGCAGDIFVQKSPAATVMSIANSLINIFGFKNNIKIIGTRYGEKKHETLISSEERVRASELNKYFRIKSNSMELNYGAYFDSGNNLISEKEDYTSENTKRLDEKELTELLLNLPYIQKQLESI
ncbi:polysaccharide biosynthesis protein [Candidatus Pacearchaeota archaeon]|jgi:UDP-glucose 4-epimerase|nr:polysaccharide biosynthesis protein [Candidatus Pacearchaeota archaeon]